MSFAVLLSCHGTVEKTADLPAFLSNIRRGRPTPPALVEEVLGGWEVSLSKLADAVSDPAEISLVAEALRLVRDRRRQR